MQPDGIVGRIVAVEERRTVVHVRVRAANGERGTSDPLLESLR